MAGIKSLAVRGIRSFGPEDNDEQRISFETPLTLILGQNGCGKTTIIECLRYAITGQMPPGSRNECFVHDAKVNRSTEVLGQVKLKIVNAKDKQLEVSRSMKVTALAKKKTKFQTLESFLSVLDDLGNPKDISSRCADLDYVMHQELGVSKAILNSVIFCHQEDSSWPLDEGKKVKERFDEIFDSDKYSDCFDRLRKIRKDYTQSLKLLEQEAAHLTEKKKDLDNIKLEVVNTETKISEAEIKVAELTSELNPVSEKLTAIIKLEKEVSVFEAKQEKIKARLEHFKAQEEELKNEIKNLFEGALSELEENINSYAAVVKSKKLELDDSVKKRNLLNKEEEKIAKEKTSNEVKFNKYILLESQNQEKIDKKNKLIYETAKLAEIPVSEITNNDEAEKVTEEIEDKLKNLDHDLAAEKTIAEEEENKMQSVVNESLASLSRHKQKIQSKELEIRDVKKDIIKTERQINDANESKIKMEEMEKKLTAAEEEYLEAEKELNTEECQNEIDEDEKLLEQHEKSLDTINEKVTVLQKQSAKLKERDFIEESLKQKEKQFSILMNKHKTALTELLGTIPEQGFAVAVKRFEAEQRKEVEKFKQSNKEKSLEMAALEAERKHVREAATARRADLTKAEDQMYRATGTMPFDATLAKVSSNVDKLQDEQNTLQSSMFIISKYKKQLQDNNCCPLCNRGFENETDVSDLLSQLSTQVINVPSKLERVTEDLQRASAKKDELLSMKSLNEKIVSLKEKDIPELEKRLNDIDTKINTLKEAVDENDTALAEPEKKLSTAKQIHGDMPLLDKYNQEIAATMKKFEAIKSQCADVDSEMTLDEATAKQLDLRQTIITIRARIKSTQSKLNVHSKKLQRMADKKNKQKEQLLNIRKKIQEVTALQEHVKQLEANRGKFLIELKELEDATAPLETDLKEKQASKDETVKKNRTEIDVKKDFLTKISNSFDKVKAVLSEIRVHEEKNIQGEMDKIKDSNESLDERKKQIGIEKEELNKKIEDFKDELAKQDIYKNDLEKNLKLRKVKVDIEKNGTELNEIGEKMNGINRDIISEKGDLITKQTQLFRDKAVTEGELKQLRTRLSQVQSDLKKALSKDIEKKYKEKFYELLVTKGIDKDIRDYSVALEKCLMEFHREKMESINMIIREMWRKIYRGNDIDYIEIKCEGFMTTDSDRRKYDYRVVQCKNGVEIDMRGRCSAGQKVLACLIIRLALAETFSSRFGILALDEPTTNLDQENIRSLCTALGEIVQERMTQKNFMFIIITHDKEFIESLGNIDKVTHYYEVSRNDDGKSRVKKIRFT